MCQFVFYSTQFCFRVHSDESFHHIQNQDPDVWHKSFYVCACQKLEGSLENTVRCSPAQTTLCTRQSSNTQKSVCSARRRRSLEYDRREIKRRFALLEDKSVEMYREKVRISVVIQRPNALNITSILIWPAAFRSSLVIVSVLNANGTEVG